MSEGARALEPRSLKVVPEPPVVDTVAAEGAIADFLRAFGLDLDDPNLRDTPRRVAQTFGEFLTQPPFRLTTFPNDEGYDELIVARNISFHSLCQHHLLPFVGVAQVAYL